MVHTLNEDCVFLELVNEQVVISTWHSDYYDPSGVINEFVTDYITSIKDEVAMQVNFNLAEILDITIANNELFLPKEDNRQFLDINKKPLFDKTKEQLLALVAKIDGLKYKDSGQINE